MLIPFTKMQGTGNDFIILNQLDVDYGLSKEVIQKLASRHYGIGFDQLLIIENSSNPKAEFKYRIFNADGNEVEQCGNGARCFFQYIVDKKLSTNSSIVVETESGLITLKYNANKFVEVNMGEPIFNYEDIPFISKNEKLKIKIDDALIDINVVSMGNPHAVIKIDDFNKCDIKEISESLQNSSQFPKSVNVGFLKTIDKNTIRLKVYERGSGLTLACGTGACAAAVIAISQKWVANPVCVEMDGGRLTINWYDQKDVILIGPAQIVFEGEINLDKFIDD
jgi:diaminopimelate epimerase